MVPRHRQTGEPTRDFPVLRAQLLVVAGELFNGQLPVHGDGGGGGCRRWFRQERGGRGVGGAGGEWAERAVGGQVLNGEKPKRLFILNARSPRCGPQRTLNTVRA